MLVSRVMAKSGAKGVQVSELTQVGSIFKDDLPAPVLALAGGVLAPLVMAVMALDLELRNSGHRRIGKGASAAPRRRRRKQRIRTP